MNKQDRATLRRLRRMITEMEVGPDVNRRDARSTNTLNELHFNSVYLIEISLRIYDEFGVDINAVDLGSMTFTEIAKRINTPRQLTVV